MKKLTKSEKEMVRTLERMNQAVDHIYGFYTKAEYKSSLSQCFQVLAKAAEIRNKTLYTWGYYDTTYYLYKDGITIARIQ